MSTSYHHSPNTSDADTAGTPVTSAGGAPAPCAGRRPRCAAEESFPRTVIRGESQEQEKSSRAHAALTDWLNVTFPLYLEDCGPESFFERFSTVTGGIFGGMTDRERGLHGWQHSFVFDRGGVMFAYGGQRNTAFLSFPGEGCAFVIDWQALVGLLRDDLHGRITRWDGAVDDFEGQHSVDHAVELYRLGAFSSGGRQPKPRQHGNWITPDDLGRTFEVGTRRSGKLLRIYEKGKQLGDASSPWVRWEVELHAVDRFIPWDVLERPGEHVAGAYPCLSWVSEQASRIRTIKAQHEITYGRLKQVAGVAYGPLVNVMLLREGSAERVVELLRRDGVPRRLAFSDDYLHVRSEADEL